MARPLRAASDEHFPSPAISLKEQFQTELDQPRVSSISDRSKSGRMGKVPVGSQELRMVKRIIELRPEFRIDPFVDGRLLLKRDIRLADVRPATE